MDLLISVKIYQVNDLSDAKTSLTKIDTFHTFLLFIDKMLDYIQRAAHAQWELRLSIILGIILSYKARLYKLINSVFFFFKQRMLYLMLF